MSSLLPCWVEGFKLGLSGRQEDTAFFYGAPTSSPKDKDRESSPHLRWLLLHSASFLFTQQPPLVPSPWPSRQSPRHPSPLRPHQPSLSPSHSEMRESFAVSCPPAPHMSIMACACLRTNKIINRKNSFKKKLSSLEISLSVSLKKSIFY